MVGGGFKGYMSMGEGYNDMLQVAVGRGVTGMVIFQGVCRRFSRCTCQSSSARPNTAHKCVNGS